MTILYKNVIIALDYNNGGDKMQEPLRIIIKHIFILLALSLLIFLMSNIGIPCLFRTVTGIPCPTCGMSRAFLSLLNLNLKQSFEFHPFLIPALITIFLAIHMKFGCMKLNKKFCNVFFTISVILLFIIYFFRLFFGTIL